MEEKNPVEKQEIKKSDADLVRESREQLKLQNDLLEAEIMRKEQLRAAAVLSGKSEATPQPQPIDTPKDYMRKVMRGDFNK